MDASLRMACVTANTQNIPTTTSGTTMEELSTTTTLNQQTSTTDSDSTTPGELTTATGLQTPSGRSRPSYMTEKISHFSSPRKRSYYNL